MLMADTTFCASVGIFNGIEWGVVGFELLQVVFYGVSCGRTAPTTTCSMARACSKSGDTTSLYLKGVTDRWGKTYMGYTKLQGRRYRLREDYL
jgi:hypothetical protein